MSGKIGRWFGTHMAGIRLGVSAALVALMLFNCMQLARLLLEAQGIARQVQSKEGR